MLNSFPGIHVSLRAFHGDLDKVEYLFIFIFLQIANCIVHVSGVPGGERRNRGSVKCI